MSISRRFAALKVVSPRYLADEAARSRFLREARAAGSVRHPNVASVFQLGTSDEKYFYAMEFVQGETLASLIKGSTCLDVKPALFKRTDSRWALAFGVGCFHRLGLCWDVPSPIARRTGSESPGALPCSSRVCARPTAIVKRSVKRLFNTSSAHDPISRATEICDTIS